MRVGRSSITKITPATRNRGRETIAQTCPQTGKARQAGSSEHRGRGRARRPAQRQNDKAGRDDPHLPRRQRQTRQRDEPRRKPSDGNSGRTGPRPRRSRTPRGRPVAGGNRQAIAANAPAASRRAETAGSPRRRTPRNWCPATARAPPSTAQPSGPARRPRVPGPPRGIPPACVRSASRFPSGSARLAHERTRPRARQHPDAARAAARSRLSACAVLMEGHDTAQLLFGMLNRVVTLWRHLVEQR
jgi:hypothetical protein